MADLLASTSDLASALQIDVADLNTASATIALAAATAVVQEAAGGQRIVQVVGDTATIVGTTESVLWLPQRPATTITTVTYDGTVLTAGTGTTATTYKVVGVSRLWRSLGWQAALYQPSSVVVVYTHGYAAGSQDLELGKSFCLSLAKEAYSNPSGAASEAIDDYRVAYERAAAAMEASPYMGRALMRKYGRTAGLVRAGAS